MTGAMTPSVRESPPEYGDEPASKLFGKVDELEAREAVLEAAFNAGDKSSALLAELERVRFELSGYLEALDEMGAFDPPGDA